MVRADWDCSRNVLLAQGGEVRDGKRGLERLRRRCFVVGREYERARPAGNERHGVVVELAAYAPRVHPRPERRLVRRERHLEAVDLRLDNGPTELCGRISIRAEMAVSCIDALFSRKRQDDKRPAAE